MAENQSYYKTIQAMRLLKKRGWDPLEIIEKWSLEVDDDGVEDTLQMKLAIMNFEKEEIGT